ncbi:MAG: hypothetical protein COA82_07445 [Alkaliphilus sp.]|nr:helix-turn-helix domain containing protein [Alkaliphilus sp. AH-315-G20]MBN4067695.1 helix-turn-helix domain containing protein [Alkaliphilus transvaalensis]MBN4069658.1 helix-turn-helix domain containing protein [bacterium AH-315-G05]PHS34202.1 MAG: hypothetical protein COA82_07445 [Alkaliphilus sp.]
MIDEKWMKRYDIIKHGMKYGVSYACREHQISRTIYYRWLKRFEASGIDGLRDVKKSVIPRNKASKQLEKEVLIYVKHYPKYGPRSIAWQLEDEGIIVSGSGVYNIMKRHDLTTKEKRIVYGKRHSKENESAKFHNKHLKINDIAPGEVWICWTNDLGITPSLGQLYKYMILDVKSGFACARIYNNRNTECALGILQEIAIPMAIALDYYPKIIFTQRAREYNSGRDYGNHKYVEIVAKMGAKHIVLNETIKEYQEIMNDFSSRVQKEINTVLFSENIDLLELRRIVKKYLVNYNFHLSSVHGEENKTPYEILKGEMSEDVVLPLWAYITP